LVYSCYSPQAKTLLFAESTLVVFWQHEDLPLLVEAEPGWCGLLSP
jgi:hypothetical protein